MSVQISIYNQIEEAAAILANEHNRFRRCDRSFYGKWQHSLVDSWLYCKVCIGKKIENKYEGIVETVSIFNETDFLSGIQFCL